MDTDKFEKKIIHLTFKGENHKEETHVYFGSVACIYEHYSVKEIGITYGSLRNYGLSEDKPYENKLVIIRQGKLWTKTLKVKRKKKDDKRPI